MADCCVVMHAITRNIDDERLEVPGKSGEYLNLGNRLGETHSLIA